MSDSLHQIVQNSVAMDDEDPSSSDSEAEYQPDPDEEKFKNVFDIGEWEPTKRPENLLIQRQKRKITAKRLLPKLIAQELSPADFKKILSEMEKKESREIMSKITKLTVKELKSRCRQVDAMEAEIVKSEAKSRGKTRRLWECDVEEEILKAELEEIEEELRKTKKFVKAHSKILKQRQRVKDAMEREKIRDRPNLPYYIPSPDDVLAASNRS